MEAIKEEKENQIVKLGQDGIPITPENKQSKSVATFNTEEKVLIEKAVLKELIEISEKENELYKRLDELNGISKDNPPLNEEEKAKIKRMENHRKRTESSYSLGAKSKTANGNRSEKFALSCAGVFEATGTSDLGFGLLIFEKVIQAASVGIDYKDQEKFKGLYDSIANVMTSLKPQDEFEGMLISKIVALHFQSMEYLGYAANKDQSTHGRDLNINRSVKLSRLYNETLDALMRYRRKGEQKVVVQHVNVNDGGKAIVGCQMTAGDGG
jgi:hypothetical protein